MRRGARRFGATALVALFVASLASLGQVPPAAQADIEEEFGLVYQDQVYGDFLLVGNGQMVCPPSTPACGAASRRENTTNNNAYDMRWADVDGVANTYNSTRAQVRIPAGSQVVFAQLSWSAHAASNGMCDPGTAAQRPPGTPATQTLNLTVGSNASAGIGPGRYEYVEDAQVSARYYSADADVTAEFADLASGQDVPVTVANLWAPQGVSCFGGWSLSLVWSYPDAGGGVPLRDVFVYDGHVRQGSADPPTTATASGFRVAGTGQARVGLTAYEGDNGSRGDRFLINGVPQSDPAVANSATNFFLSRAEGQLDPLLPNNFAVDAKSMPVPGTVLAPGATSANLTFDTTGETYMAQGLVLSVPIPELRVTKSVEPRTAREGEPLTWTIRVSNPSESTATAVAVDDPALPQCNRGIGVLPAGEAVTYTCASTAPAEELVNRVDVTGRDSAGGELVGFGTATVGIDHPNVTIEKTTAEQQVVDGEEAVFAITVTNTGDTGLTDVTVDDPAAPDCARQLGSLLPGEQRSWTCTQVASGDELTNTAAVTGQPPRGAPVSDEASAAVGVIRPAIAVTKSADPGVVRQGDDVTFRFVVTNSGDSPLTDVSVDDPAFPACDRAGLGRLESGEQLTYSCTVTAPSDDVVNHAVAGAQPAAGPPIQAPSESVTVDVIHPSILVDKTTLATSVEPGQPVSFTISVTNTGDVDLTDAAVTDELFPDCERSVGTLAAGGTTTYQCSGPAPVADVTNTAVATGQPPIGDVVSDSDAAPVSPVRPDIAVTKTADRAVARPGDPVSFTFTLLNTGGTPLDDVALRDPAFPSCDREDVPLLATGESVQLECDVTAPFDDVVNSAVASGTSPAGTEVEAADQVTVDVIHPELSVSKVAEQTMVRGSETVQIRIVVRNSGDVPVAGTTVGDDVAPACGRGVGALDPGEEVAYTCEVSVADDHLDVATAAGTDPLGNPVEASDSAVIDAIHPGITVSKAASPDEVEEGDAVTFTIGVRNTGDVDLTDVSASDAMAPACARPELGDLQLGESTSYTCSMTAGAEDFTNTAAARGTAPIGPAVTDEDSVEVEVTQSGSDPDPSDPDAADSDPSDPSEPGTDPEDPSSGAGAGDEPSSAANGGSSSDGALPDMGAVAGLGLLLVLGIVGTLGGAWLYRANGTRDS